MDGSVFSWWMKEISELSKRNEALCCLHLFLYALHDLWSLKTHKYQCIGCCSTEQKYECQLLKNNTNNINIFSIPKYSTYFMPRHENLDCIPSASLQGVSTIDCSTSNWQRSCSQNIDYCKVIIVLPPKKIRSGKLNMKLCPIRWHSFCISITSSSPDCREMPF
jgi:hypothetical protein